MYVLTPLYFQPLTEIIENISDSINIISESDIFSLSVPTLTSLYIIHVIITLLIGRIYGTVDDRWLNPDRVLDRRPPWQYAFDEANSEEVEVKLNDGTVIQGQFNEAAWDKDEHELYIEDPDEVEYKKGETVGEPVDLGRSILLKGSAITQVIFTKEDPDTEMNVEVEEIPVSIGEEIDEILHDYGEQEELSTFGEDGEEINEAENEENRDKN
ncbi:hypothetical protein ELS17_15755 [Natrinema altunense]|uniref:Uncharacterized protein n=2 Tax=Natrinema altunense TaxID=222984 RepID=A0A482XV05_9EURY|nr:hypothetical protein ELS17_15755 [Natrinema altunense]